MSAVERGQSKLAEVLTSRLQSLIVDDERAAEHEAIVREAQAVEARQRRSDRLEALGIQLERKAHVGVIADSGLLETTSLLAVKRWLWRPDLKSILVLAGGTGRGKSVAAGWAVASFSGASAWYSAAEIVRIFSTSFGEERKLQERIKRVGLLVIDDVATEGNAVRMCAALVEILEERKQRKTLATTNQGHESWIKRYPDERLQSRLKDAYFVTDNKGEDLRGKP